MKKIKFLIIIASMFFIPSVLMASPFLVCDPYPQGQIQPDYFVLNIDGKDVISQAIINPDNSKQLKYDIGWVSPGSHSLTVKACIGNNSPWDLCSEAVPFDFTRPFLAAPPSGLKLIR